MRLRIPSALPYFFGGLRISSGLALIGAVVAEFVAGTGGSGAGLAYQILQAGFRLNIPRMFAALLLISLTGVALFAAAFELRPHGLHLRIKIVKIVQHERFGEHRQLGRAEIVLAVVADNQVLDQRLERIRKLRHLLQLGLEHFQFDDHVSQ